MKVNQNGKRLLLYITKMIWNLKVKYFEVPGAKYLQQICGTVPILTLLILYKYTCIEATKATILL